MDVYVNVCLQVPAPAQPATRSGAEEAAQQQQQQGAATEQEAVVEPNQEPDPAVVRRYVSGGYKLMSIFADQKRPRIYGGRGGVAGSQPI